MVRKPRGGTDVHINSRAHASTAIVRTLRRKTRFRNSPMAHFVRRVFAGGWVRFVRRILASHLSFTAYPPRTTDYCPRGFVCRESRCSHLAGFVSSAARVPFLREHLDHVEFPADLRDLLVRSRVSASRAEVVLARPLSGAAIRYGSSPGAEGQVLWGLRLNSDR